MADEPFLPQPDTPELADTPELPGTGDVTPAPLADEDFEPEPKSAHTGGRKSAAAAALPWFLAAIVVVLLAASGGLVSAWLVATLRAVPAPALADVTPPPAPATSTQPSTAPTAPSSEQPRHTPTPAPVTTQEPAPFIHIVQRGESLSYIADLYGVTVEDIVALNDIANPNRIRVGKELLIPGYGHRPSS